MPLHFEVPDLEALTQAYKTKEFLYLQNALPSKTLSTLMPWSAINQILRHARLNAPRMRIHKNGHQIPEEEYTIQRELRRGGNYKRLVEEKFYKVLRDQGTLVIDAIDELYDPLDIFCGHLERTFQETVQVNAYMSWGAEKGFTTHWDDHDVLIVQVDGQKEWFLFGETRKYPMYRDLHPSNNIPPQTPTWTKVIQAGDILFIPRGHWHHAVALNEPSLHLTFGFTCSTGLSFMGWLQEKMALYESARMTLPSLGNAQDIQVHEDSLKEDIKKTLATYTLQDYFLETRSKSLNRQRFSLPYAITKNVLPKHHNFQIILNIPFLENYKVDAKLGTLSFQSLGKTFTFSLKTHPILTLLKDFEPHFFKEIFETVKEEIPEEEIREFLSKLLLSGLIALSHP